MKNLIALMMTLLLLVAGCATTNKSGRLLATTVQTVDAAMQGWAVWVVMGNASNDQQEKVKASYARYQLAIQAAEKAYVAAAKTGNEDFFTATSSALLAAKTDLLALINSFQNRPVNP